MGGYFIVNGLEKVLRLLQVPMRNMALAIKRPAYRNRGAFYTEYAVMMRCARVDQSTSTITLHYLSTGTLRLRLSVRKQEFMVPLTIILKALQPDCSDRDVYAQMIGGSKSGVGTIIAPQIEGLMREQSIYARRHQISSPIALLGSMFASLFREHLPLDADNALFGKFFLEKFIAVHVDDFSCKHNVLVLMARKLYCFARHECCEDNVDSIGHQELLLPGHILSAYIKEKLEESLAQAASHVRRDARTDFNNTRSKLQKEFRVYCGKILGRYVATIGSKTASFLATGNLVSSSGLDLQQTTGFAIVAERLNKWRYLSHFRSVHRGQFFTTMKTTAVRKLLPESWGFLCPVHTPDGSPCGLLSHLAARAHIVCSASTLPNSWRLKLIDIAVSLGMSPTRGSSIKMATNIRKYWPDLHMCPCRHWTGDCILQVCLDGIVLGSASNQVCVKITVALRRLKVKFSPTFGIDKTIEIAHVNQGIDSRSPFSGLYLFSQAARFVRPVIQCGISTRIELIGPFEQMTLQIACNVDGKTLSSKSALNYQETHLEIDPMNMLSVLATLTPFSEFNQSPRNMYQCQMGKQTMGTPAHSLPHRCDNKLYRILTPQAPLVCTHDYRNFNFDLYAQGTNSVVAVVSYTGYDMEDAMIINKSAYERGFSHGVVYKNILVDLDVEAKRRKTHENNTGLLLFGNLKSISHVSDKLDSCDSVDDTTLLGEDGLPEIGQKICTGELLWCAFFEHSGERIYGKHQDETAYVDAVRFLGYSQGKELIKRKACITLRFPRNPVIGDKFSSRHGQKGVLSILWPECDMPFTESGFTPDIIINPHAFPSRMTIGMLIESMAGKSAALSGRFQDGTPFNFHEDFKAIDFFGNQLCAAGYEYYGSEPVYSGFSGLLMRVELFIGVVYYQRLRHMVSDKSQVRATGPIHQLTHQPIKGRKRHGGIRLGEMERDALLAHGSAFLLYDRLMVCSDSHSVYVCANPVCGSILTPCHYVLPSSFKFLESYICYECRGRRCLTFAMPYVYRYLTNELAGMNIKLKLLHTN